MPLETNQVKGLALIAAVWNGAGAAAAENAVEDRELLPDPHPGEANE
ncbi:MULTISPECIES: hypothetical protein [Rhizobium]|nr:MULTISPECIES: hypothetical protein [Rhizobium]